MRLLLALALVLLIPSSAYGASFGAPIDLGVVYPVEQPVVPAVAPDGSVIVATVPTDRHLVVTRIGADGVRGPAQQLAADAEELGVATNGTTAALTWVDYAHDQIRVAISHSGGPFGAPRRLARFTNKFYVPEELQAIATPTGLVATWAQHDAVFASVADANGAFGAPQQLTRSNRELDLSIGTGPDGRVAIAWLARKGPGTPFYAELAPGQRRFGPARKHTGLADATVSNGQLGPILGTSSKASGGIGALGVDAGDTLTSIATVPSGDVASIPVFAAPGAGLPLTAAWLVGRPKRVQRLVIAERAAAGTPWSAQRVVDQAAFTADPAAGASATSSALAWVRAKRIYTITRTNADPYSAPFALSGAHAGAPKLAAGAGAIAASWTDDFGSNSDRDQHAFLAILRG